MCKKHDYSALLKYMHMLENGYSIRHIKRKYGINDSTMIVDHIDTNRCNKRSENLSWLTRLENAFNNPYTRNKTILWIT